MGAQLFALVQNRPSQVEPVAELAHEAVLHEESKPAFVKSVPPTVPVEATEAAKEEPSQA